MSDAHLHFFTRMWRRVARKIDLAALALELERLCEELRQEAENPEQAQAVAMVASAEQFARQGDGARMMALLADVGDWPRETAARIDASLAAGALHEACRGFDNSIELTPEDDALMDSFWLRVGASQAETLAEHKEPPLITTPKIANLSETEYAVLLAACKRVPKAKGDYHIHNFVENLLLTVVDFMTHTTAVENAMNHFKSHTKQDAADLAGLKAILAQYPNDKAGNLALAQRLWGYNMWTRAEMLRGLVPFFEAAGVTDQTSLEQWAMTADFKKDFEGKVKGLGYAVFNWLVMRQGVETIKPDVHILRFVAKAIGRPVPDTVAVASLIKAARDLERGVHEMDWAIWETARGERKSTGSEHACLPCTTSPIPKVDYEE